MRRMLATTVACAAAGMLGLSLTANSLAQMDQGQTGQQNQTAQGEQKTITGQLVYLHTFMTGEQVTQGAAAGAGATGATEQPGQLGQENQPGQTQQPGQTEQNQPGQAQTGQPGQMGQSQFGAQAQGEQLQGPDILAVHTNDGKLIILDVAKVQPGGQAIGQEAQPGQEPGQTGAEANPAQPDQQGATETPGATAQPGQQSATETPGATAQPGQFGAEAGESAQQQWQQIQQDAQRYLNRQVKVEGTIYQKAGVQYLVAQTLEPATASARNEQQQPGQAGQNGQGG